MITEDLLLKAEALVRAKHPRGIVGQVSEIYILTTAGEWLTRPWVVKDKEQSRMNSCIIRLMIHALSVRRHLAGVVQVSTGWIIPGLPPTTIIKNPLKCKNREEVLLFNGRAQTGPKVRVYKLMRKGRLKLAHKLVGTFDGKPGSTGGV
jgi:hypothetical protein